MTPRRILSIMVVAVLVAAFCVLWLWPRHPKAVFAQSGWVAGSLQDSAGGMSQYGAAELTSTSSSSDLQALTNWNNYINARCGWSLSSSDLNRLANADYNARQAGAAKITPQQLANAINSVVNSTLNTMSASQQQSLFNQNAFIGSFLVNTPDPNVSATESSSSTWTVSVSSAEFSSRKSFFQAYAPGMVTSSSNFYPGEAMMVTYSLATGDMGFNNTFVSAAKQLVGNALAVNMTSQLLYGDNDYMIRRPMHTFLTEPNISQFFTDLGF